MSTGFYPNPRPQYLGVVPDGDDGIRQTLKLMVAITRQYKKDPGVRQVAASLVRNLPQGDTTAEVKALHAFVRDSIRYTNDTRDMELLQTPVVTLQEGVGDCDDKSTLLAALLESIGRPTRFAAIAVAPSRSFSHVYAETRLGAVGKWVPLETIKPVQVGWEPSRITRKMVAHV